VAMSKSGNIAGVGAYPLPNIVAEGNYRDFHGLALFVPNCADEAENKAIPRAENDDVNLV